MLTCNIEASFVGHAFMVCTLPRGTNCETFSSDPLYTLLLVAKHLPVFTIFPCVLGA
jgi:hypothetical protein